MIYVYIGAWIGFGALALSMAEMASMCATRRHWSSNHAEIFCTGLPRQEVNTIGSQRFALHRVPGTRSD